MGRRRVCPDHVVERVAELRWRGLSFRRICTTMQDEGITTPTGKTRWWPETVNKLLQTAAGRAATARLGEISMAAEVSGTQAIVDHSRSDGGGDRPVVARALRRGGPRRRARSRGFSRMGWRVTVKVSNEQHAHYASSK